MSQEDKARDLVAKADKKLSSFSVSSFFMGSDAKYEQAEEMYKKAANQFKVAKNWNEAGAAFESAAKCHLKLNSPHDIASAYQDAATCYKKTDAQQALRCYREVVQVHIDLGRFTMAAKIQKEIGELLEAEGDTAAALDEYQQAADFYKAEESHSQANQVGQAPALAPSHPRTLAPSRPHALTPSRRHIHPLSRFCSRSPSSPRAPRTTSAPSRSMSRCAEQSHPRVVEAPMMAP